MTQTLITQYPEREVLDGTIVLCVGYDGARFSGYAEQPGQLTVAGETSRLTRSIMPRPASPRASMPAPAPIRTASPRASPSPC